MNEGTPTNTETPIKPASTVLLLRDGAAGLEVFMVKRHHAIDFASGALVFPGGKLEDSDGEDGLRRCTDGADGLADDQLAFQIGAIREAFEEAGILLARAAGSDSLITGERLQTLASRYRKPLEAGGISMAALAEKEQLRYAADLLTPFARWITPNVMPKRFDTQFYLAPATAAHLNEAQHDGGETVESVWIRPQDVLEAAADGAYTLVFATEMNVRKLAEHNSVEAAINAAQKTPIVTVLPKVERRGTERWLVIPAEAGYGVTEVNVTKISGKK